MILNSPIYLTSFVYRHQTGAPLVYPFPFFPNDSAKFSLPFRQIALKDGDRDEAGGSYRAKGKRLWPENEFLRCDLGVIDYNDVIL